MDIDRFIQSYDTALIEMNKKIRVLQLIGNRRPLSYREQFDLKYLMILRTKYLALRRKEFAEKGRILCCDSSLAFE